MFKNKLNNIENCTKDYIDYLLLLIPRNACEK